jgi:hypothetical protein
MIVITVEGGVVQSVITDRNVKQYYILNDLDAQEEGDELLIMQVAEYLPEEANRVWKKSLQAALKEDNNGDTAR